MVWCCGVRTAYLSANGEETSSVRIHKNEFVRVASIGSIRVNSEDDSTLAIVDGEAITRKEKRGFENCEVDLFFEHIPFFQNHPFFHLLCGGIGFRSHTKSTHGYG